MDWLRAIIAENQKEVEIKVIELKYVNALLCYHGVYYKVTHT